MFSLIVILSLCVIASITEEKVPQVYEKVDDQVASETNTRIVRDPFNQQKNIKNYQPPIFKFQSALQQDQRRFRYAEQQRVDIKNLLKKVKLTRSLDGSLNLPSASQLKVEEKTNKTEESIWDKISQRKFKPTSDSKVKINRQDYNNNQIIYVQPDALKKQFQVNEGTEHDISALNALVGQSPNAQLEGLKRLIESPHSNYVLPPIKGPLPSFQTKDHTPITEETIDIPNFETHPNIKIDSIDDKASLEAIQAQLDAVSKAHLEKAMAKAQQDAMAQVEAQHRAIAKAQIEAEKKALAKIALHNEGLKTNNAQLSLALPLKSELPTNLYLDNHQNETQNEKPKSNLEKISTTKSHSITQGRQSPNTFQEVVLETQHQSQKVFPNGGVHHNLAENLEGHQPYAARYAFGYRIRDVKMGNEFGHEEEREGKSAKGHYHVLLPDGRLQKVEYYADPSGYHAKVSYENVAHR